MKVNEITDKYLGEVKAPSVIRKDFPQIADFVKTKNISVSVPNLHGYSLTFNINRVSSFPGTESEDWFEVVIGFGNNYKSTRVTVEDFDTFANDLISGLKKMHKDVKTAKVNQNRELSKK